MTCALVIGSGETLWSDIKAVEEILGRKWDGPVVACNGAGMLYPGRLTDWVSFHPDRWLEGQEWARRRRENGFNEDYVTWTVAGCDGHADRYLSPEDVPSDGKSAGTSGLLAAVVAIKQYGRGVLCGIPMDRRPHVRGSMTEGAFKTDNQAYDDRRLTSFRACWTAGSQILVPSLRSMSGWTGAQYGAPTREWLEGL